MIGYRHFLRFGACVCAMPSSVTALLLAALLSLPAAVGLAIDADDDAWTAGWPVYRAGTPHTDARGGVRRSYDPAASFFPIGLYHAVTGEHFGRTYSLEPVKAAGFNTLHLWEGQSPVEAVAAAGALGLHLIIHQPDDTVVRTLANSPSLLAWYLDEEPSLNLPLAAQAAARAAFERRFRAIRALDSRHPIFALDYPGFLGQGRADWLAWARIGDLSAHDNYPIRSWSRGSLDTTDGIPRSVALAVRATGEHKPVWLVVQAMAGPGYGWRMPTPDEVRAMVYAGLIHGATGIIYFAFDSFVTREGQILGMAPDPPASYGPTPGFGNPAVPTLIASEADRAASRRLWAAVAGLNRELAALAPALLSPTASEACRVTVGDNRDWWGSARPAAPIRTLLKDGPGGPVLLAVNLDRRPLSATIDCHHPDLGPVWHRQEDFAPLAVHVYRLE